MYETIIDLEINKKLGYLPHYPGSIQTQGFPKCKIPGILNICNSVSIVSPTQQQQLTNHCYEYGNTRFPPTCGCNEIYGCKSGCYGKSTKCMSTCGTCNHNECVIHF
jgi:hypothetical protein